MFLMLTRVNAKQVKSVPWRWHWLPDVQGFVRILTVVPPYELEVLWRFQQGDGLRVGTASLQHGGIVGGVVARHNAVPCIAKVVLQIYRLIQAGNGARGSKNKCAHKILGPKVPELSPAKSS